MTKMPPKKPFFCGNKNGQFVQKRHQGMIPHFPTFLTLQDPHEGVISIVQDFVTWPMYYVQMYYVQKMLLYLLYLEFQTLIGHTCTTFKIVYTET